MGPKRRRAVLTSLAFALFCGVIVMLVFGAVRLDDWLRLSPLVPAAVGMIAGLPLFGVGIALTSWCIVVFLSAGGTPVPFSPPRQLVARGPYLRVRNPMVTGLLVSLLGAGLLLRSQSLALGLTPLMGVGAWIELKLVEEPELQQRLGAAYAEYRRQVPMFVPRLSRWRGASSN